MRFDPHDKERQVELNRARQIPSPALAGAHSHHFSNDDSSVLVVVQKARDLRFYSKTIGRCVQR